MKTYVLIILYTCLIGCSTNSLILVENNTPFATTVDYDQLNNSFVIVKKIQFKHQLKMVDFNKATEHEVRNEAIRICNGENKILNLEVTTHDTIVYSNHVIRQSKTSRYPFGTVSKGVLICK